MILAATSVTVGNYDPTIWIPVITAFFGLLTAVILVFNRTGNTQAQVQQVHALVNSNLTAALTEITRLRTIMETSRIVSTSSVDVPSVQAPMVAPIELPPHTP